MRTLTLLLITTVLAGCAQNVRQVSIQDLDSFSPMPVYYVTNRGDSNDPDLNKRYTTERDSLSYGVSTIAIPARYPKALTPSFLYWNLRLKRNPDKHIALLSMDALDKTRFFTELNRQSSKSALIFIHGFNTPFERANRITAKLAYDLNFTGPIILFSWPSLAAPTLYSADEANLEWSQPDLETVLSDLFEQTDFQWHLMAHSLGNRALTNALIHQLTEHPEWVKRIDSVTLAAPDIDAGNFERSIGPQLTQLQLPITLYISANDLALKASHSIHKNPRAGEAGENIIVLPGIDTVDASLADAEVFGHEYYYQGPHVITDLYQWLVQGKPVDQRDFLEQVQKNSGHYWQIKPFDDPDQFSH